MPDLLFQVVTVVFNLIIIVFVTFYLLNLRKKEKDLDERARKIEENYDAVANQALQQQNQIVAGAVNQSNQMMQIASHQANQILAGAQYLSQTTKATLDASVRKMVVDVEGASNNSKITLEQTLQQIVTTVHKEAFDTGKEVTDGYHAHLKKITDNSISGFQNVTNELELEMSKQIKEFRGTLLTNLEKEIDDYKQQKIRRIDQASVILVQRVSQEVMNKSLTIEDHEKLVIRSLEKAKKEGVFD